LSESLKKVILLGGPTASGKTKISLDLVRQYNGEIICGDSMQVYADMVIGTASPTDEEKAAAPHHLFNEISPFEEFSVAKWAELAHNKIIDVQGRGKVPIIVGGTGLYLDTIADNRRYIDIPKDDEFRAGLGQMTNSELYQRLKDVDPESADKLSESDNRRVVRALEIYNATGKTKTQIDRESLQEPIYDITYYVLKPEREELYKRINDRVDVLINLGLVDECRALLARGIDEKYSAYNAIGYRQIYEYLKGETTLNDAIDKVKQATRNYAKRQMTWWRKRADVICLER
jgi:tRNA dimethylallyltransferase